MSTDVLVVGAGYAGAILAERLASAGREVLVIDRRDHIAGNAYDHTDSHGILVHKYGPHLFHTNSDAVFEYLSRFTDWHPYEHRVLVSLDGKFYPLPINQDTINQLYGLNLDEAGVEQFLAGVREHRDPVLTSEDVVLNAVGRELCDKIFRGYTRKQWSRPCPPRATRASSSGFSRIPEFASKPAWISLPSASASSRDSPSSPGASTNTSASGWGGYHIAQSASNTSTCP
jgi:UDP-galactopyranose mutase